jgi:hypothetical protein
VTRSDLAPLLIALHDLQDKITLDKRHTYRKEKQPKAGTTTVIKTLNAPQLNSWMVRVQVEGTARAAWNYPPPTWAQQVSEEEQLAGEAEYIDELVALAKKEFEHERIANAAADLGNQVHGLIHHAVVTQLGGEMPEPQATDQALFIFAGWREWADRVGLEPLMAEGKIHHPALDYCGTFDLLALVDGQPTILDWKASPRMYDERRLQSAAYRMALMYSGWPPLQGAIVCLPRDGGEIQTMQACPPGPSLDATFEAFTALLRVYRWQKEVARAERKAAKDDEAA